MAKKYQLSDEAELDVEEGYGYYESKREGLGEEFLSDLDHAKSAILSNPVRFRFRHKNIVRGYVVRRFPYLILYTVTEEGVDVIAVFNTRQNPKKWVKRVIV